MTRRRKRIVAGGVIGLVIVYFLLCWSGLLFPIRHPTEGLDAALKRDLGVGLPTGATVVKATRVATRDPARYYELQLPAGSVMPFVAAIHSASRVKVEEHEGTRWSPHGPAPTWWTPATLPDGQRIDVHVPEPQGGYVLFYSPSSPTVLVFWFET